MVYFQPVQDIQISTRAEPRAIPVHADRHRRRRRSASGPTRLAERLQSSPIAARRRLRGAGGRLPDDVQVDRETAGRLGISMQTVNDTLNDAFGQRQISTIYGQANQYRVILEAKPRIPARSDLAVEALRSGLRQPGGGGSRPR